jgi:2-keto-4-pentenoate hydratase/2-oxohepta-3-ene-1,7-dioic acid hydratase in catechol pathway
MDALREAKAAGKPWTKDLAFDYSLAIGEWTNGEWAKGEWLMSPEEAIVEASKVMTIRQGDLIYIQADCEPRRVQKEEVLRVEVDGEEKLYCKIK